jgi:hypothetical protein
MNRTKLNEDWTAVIIGWISLLIVLLKFTPGWPSFGWKNTIEFSEKIITSNNLLQISLLFVFILLLVLLAFTLKNIRCKSNPWLRSYIFYHNNRLDNRRKYNIKKLGWQK